ncbi:MAG TPA: hypothetical protein VEX57_10590 [Microlunatus sp.]|nr:hypothetical protein [Microlunatus sp.]
MVEPVAPGGQLVAAALLGTGLVVILITWAKVHPFLAMILGALTAGILAGQTINDVIESFATRFGDTAAGLGSLIALGAMFAQLLADSGAADQFATPSSARRPSSPWERRSSPGR